MSLAYKQELGARDVPRPEFLAALAAARDKPVELALPIGATTDSGAGRMRADRVMGLCDAPAGGWAPGVRVVLRGLVSAAALNGFEATVEGFQPATGRYALLLIAHEQPGKRINAKPQNIAAADGPECAVGGGRREKKRRARRARRLAAAGTASRMDLEEEACGLGPCATVAGPMPPPGAAGLRGWLAARLLTAVQRAFPALAPGTAAHGEQLRPEVRWKARRRRRRRGSGVVLESGVAHAVAAATRRAGEPVAAEDAARELCRYFAGGGVRCGPRLWHATPLR
jgi:hypothetical protein